MFTYSEYCVIDEYSIIIKITVPDLNIENNYRFILDFIK